MRILAIETSCDDTSVALIGARGGFRNPHFKIFKNLVSSQIKIHRPYGGVVPMLAKREHAKNLPKILGRIMNKELRTKGKILIPKIDLIAVTVGPGLDPALWTGIEFAQKLAKEMKKPLIGTNHLEGHLYSFLLTPKISNSKLFPAISLIVSGGHTILLVMQSLTKWKKIGETRDDAAGEAFDKVARLLDLPYPGGPEIEKLAKKGNPQAINFPRPMLNLPAGGKNYDFSFSGLKTAVLYFLRDNPGVVFADVAASFQQAAIDVLVGKTIRAAREFGAKSVFLAGGVAANKKLRGILKLETKKLGLNFSAPPFNLNTDNAVMIAAAAYMRHLSKRRLRLVSQPHLNL